MEICARSSVTCEERTENIQAVITVLLFITGAHVPASVIVLHAGYSEGDVSFSHVYFRELNPAFKLRSNPEISFSEIIDLDFLQIPFDCRTPTITRNVGRASDHHQQA